MFVGELPAGILLFVENDCQVYSDFEVISTLYIRTVMRSVETKGKKRKEKKRKEISNIYFTTILHWHNGPISHRVAAGSAAVEQCQDLLVDRYLICLPGAKTCLVLYIYIYIYIVKGINVCFDNTVYIMLFC